MPSVVYRLSKVCEITGKCRSDVYKEMDEGTFPEPVQLGPQAVGWLADEIHAWIDARPRGRRGKALAPKSGTTATTAAKADASDTTKRGKAERGNIGRRQHAA
jgi:prophage regulatory protein